MKIALLNDPITLINPQRVGGAERVLLYELRYLNLQGFQARLYTRGFIGEHPYVKVKNFDYNKDLGRLYYAWFVRENLETDILHSMNAPILSLVSNKPSRTLIHLQNITSLPHYELAKKRYWQSFFAFCSSFLRDDFLRRYPEVPPEKCFVIHNGVDTKMFKSLKRREERDKPRVLFTGCWKEDKGIFVFLRAIKLLEKRRRDFQALLGGSPFLYDVGAPLRWQLKMERNVKALAGKISSVRILGLMNYDHQPQLFQSIDIFVNPATWQEPFGLVNIEAMATELPVIGSNVGGIPEIIINGKTGILVPPNDAHALAEAIGRLLDDEKLRYEMGREGRRRVERFFTWDIHVDKLITTYRLMMGV